MKRIFLCLTILTAFVFANAQPRPNNARQTVNKPNYELADQFSAKKINNMVFSLDVRPQWFKNSDKFWYQWKTSKGTTYYIVDPVAKTKKEIFNMERLAMQLTQIVKDPFDAQHIPIENLKLVDDTKFTFDVKSTLLVDKKVKEGEEKPKKPEKEKKTFRFEYLLSSGELKDVSDVEPEKEYPDWANISPDGTKAIFAKNLNLWWMDMADVKKLMENEKDSTVIEHQLSFDGVKDFDYGGNDYDGTSTRDTTKRFSVWGVWSPDAKHFAVPKIDMREIKDLWVINSLTEPRPTLETYKYMMPGEQGPKEYLFLFDMENYSSKMIKVSAFKDQTIDLLTKPRKNSDMYEKYRKAVWLGDNDAFYMRRLSRDIKRMDLCKVNVAGDSAVVVLEERMNTYIEFLNPELVNGGSEIIEWSERNGWANLYLYSGDGNVKKNINDAAYHVSDIIHVDNAGRVVYFTASGVNKDENPYYIHLYKINFDGSGLQKLDYDNYCSSRVYKSDNGKYFVNNYSRVDTQPRSTLFDIYGRKIMDLEEADFSLLLASGYKFPEQFKVKAADGVTDLWGVMYKPFDFDSTKSYPIIDYVYPGPQVEGNFINWSRNFTRTDRLAQIGFIVITVGNRGGHPDRSKWYHNYGYGNLRDYGLEDQKYAIQQLSTRHNFIDINKVGIHGHSGGGFMSTAAILTYPDFFKVAVSCSGNHDNRIYNRWWSEQHHGILEEISAEGDTTFKYSIKTNQELAKNLKGHLLLVTGDIDNNVHPGNTIRVVDALIRANKRFDMLILPGQRHGYGNMNEYFFWRLADYYSEYLLGQSQKERVDIGQMNND